MVEQSVARIIAATLSTMFVRRFGVIALLLAYGFVGLKVGSVTGVFRRLTTCNGTAPASRTLGPLKPSGISLGVCIYPGEVNSEAAGTVVVRAPFTRFN
jgi:hypothetical protein